MKNIKVVIKNHNGAKEEVKEIPNTLEALQKAVGGYITQVGHPELQGIGIICDEEGLLKGKDQNIWMENIGFGGQWLVGTIVFVALGEDGEYANLTDEQIEKISNFIWN